MSSMPECKKCGDYIHHGPILCDECGGKLLEERERQQAEIERLRKGIRVAIEYCDILYCEKHKDWRIPGYSFGCGDKHG